MFSILQLSVGVLLVGGASYIVYNRFRTLVPPLAEDREFLKQALASSKVLVLSKTYCPYCRKAKTLLLDNLRAKDVTVIELDQREDGERLQSAG